MTPQEKELAQKRALAKARARSRMNAEGMLPAAQANQAEVLNGNLAPGTESQGSPNHGQSDADIKLFNELTGISDGWTGRAAAFTLQGANGLTWGGLDRGPQEARQNFLGGIKALLSG